MHTHDGVVADTADQPRLLAVVRTQVIVIRHAVGKRKPGANRRPVEPTRKLNPFAAVARPRLSAKRLGHSGRDQCLLEFSQMFAHRVDQRLVAEPTARPPSTVLYEPE